MNKSVCLGLSILELRIIMMHEFWYDYLYIKTDDIYEGIAEDFEIRFFTSNFELHRALLNEINKKVITWMKNELGGKIMPKFVGLRAKNHIYLIDGGSEDKKKTNDI